MQLAPRNHQSAETMKELRVLNARFIHNFVTNDVPSHDAILHPGFVNIWPTGQRWDRATYLKYWATAFDPKVIVYWDVRDELITVIGDVALVRATNKHTRRRDGKEAGYITSAVASPALKANIALGYVRREHNQIGAELTWRTTDGESSAKIVELPFRQDRFG